VGVVISFTVFSSILGWLDRSLAALAALSPVLILRGEVWRLVTWPFVQESPFTLLFGCFMLWSFGQQLSYVWSERRFLTRFVGYTLGAGVLTTLLALVWAPATTPHLGIWPIVNALLFAWAMLYPDRQVNIWGILPLTGKTLALLVVGGTLLYGIAAGGVAGIGAFAPHLFAIGIAWVQGRPRARRRPLSDQARRWWSERETKRRAKHLKVVRKDGSGDRPWMN
jgi:membrane associated rhomboid family serine protease